MRNLLTVCIALALVIGAPAFAAESMVDVIVVLKAPPAPGKYAENKSSAEAVARDLGLVPKLSFGNVLYGFAATVPSGRLSALQNDPRVDFINFDLPVYAFAPADDFANPSGAAVSASGGQQTPWGISYINAPLSANTGEGVDVYVIDTGVDSNHPDLATPLGSSTAIVSCSGSTRTCLQKWDDDNGHGTHVAGTIAARNNTIDVVGVAPKATLHAVKVLNKNGSGTWSGVIAGIDWVAAKKTSSVVVANMSLGGSGAKGTGTCSSAGYNPGTGNPDAMYKSICTAAGKGVIFAVAAGNNGADASTSVPAAYYDAVITVSAMSSAYDWPSWSNWGIISNAAIVSTPSLPVSITAPGVNILSLKAGGGTTTLSGTSMATPHVAGALALVIKGIFSTGYNALIDARSDVTDPATSVSTTSWTNTSNHPHAERFLSVANFNF